MDDDIHANTENLVSFVKEESEDHPFSVVWGEEGLGKTTLVQNVYNDPKVRHKFTGCAWITVTPQLQPKTLWKDILSQIDYGRKDDELNKLTDDDLFLKLRSALRDVHNKYLIVLDDICSEEGLLKFMPADKVPSKVVITTRDKEKTKEMVKERGRFLKMRPQTEDESWQILKTQLLSHPSVLSVLQNHWLRANGPMGSAIPKLLVNVYFERTLKEMCRKCKGVPLALKLLGNLVAWKERNNCNELLQQSRVSAQELLGFSSSPKLHPCDLLGFSYRPLPEDLKKCLHYLALFPKETVDIEAEKLCNLWIADEEINKMKTTTSQPQDGMLSTAETYLKELATRGLVQVQEEETPTPTKIKSCSLPHYVRDYLCRVIAKEQSLFATEDLRTRSSNQETHRPQVQVPALAFYFDKRVDDDKFQLKPKETHKGVRSILFLNTRQQDDHLFSPKSLDLTNCKLLRALDFNWLDFRAFKFPQHIKNLAHLRYLSFRDCYLEEFPPSIEKLEKLETLDLRVNPKVDYKMRKSNVLCQLRRLRSLYLPYKFEPKKLELDRLSELENLQNFVSTHCRANDLSSLQKLRFLAATIDGDVQDLNVTIECLQGTSKSSSIHLKKIDFRSERRAPALSKLLECGSLNALHVHGPIGKLPLPRHTSDKLTEIFLTSSELKEDPMPLLGNFPKLQKLGLLGNSPFLGDQIICRKSGFPELRYLKLSNLPELKTWTLEEGAMLKLSTLIIENCKRLETLPGGLSSTHLQELSIVKMPKTFTKKYKSQGEDFSKIKRVLSIKIIDV